VEVREFLESTPWEGIVSRVAELASSRTSEAAETLFQMMHVKFDVPARFYFARIVSAALVQHGPEGIKLLRRAIDVAPYNTYANSALEAIYLASDGNLSALVQSTYGEKANAIFLPPSEPTMRVARTVFEDVVLESHGDEKLFDRVIGFLYQGNLINLAEGGDNFAENHKKFRDEVLRVLRDSTLQLRPRLLEHFDELIAAEAPEEEYQKFLAANPVMLDPLADLVVPKQKLGVEHITDFVLHRLDDQYVLVEIEKPQDRVFTQANDFSAVFTHALGQVLDFRSWVGQHGEYARSLIPGISPSAPGLLVIGLRSKLSDDQACKLRAFNENSPTISVVTFDDLSSKAKTVYSNMIRR
jgi:Domain of unknown function (DUF4263)